MMKTSHIEASADPAIRPLHGEYWFVAPPTPAGAADLRLKLVNTDDYFVNKPKEGWLDVKDHGSVKSRWVVVKVW